jgi:peptide-methionine (S)-S-oxide reductase
MSPSRLAWHALPFAVVAFLVGLVIFKPGGEPSRADSTRLVAIPPPALDEPETAPTAAIVLAGGCFWGVQAVYQRVEGVTSAVSGYAGGDRASASYALVSNGRTRHAEAVRVVYQPGKVSLGHLLHIFFSIVHDPTQLDRQGPDIGAHYRSAVFPATEQQERIARAYIAQLDRAASFGGKIVTRIERGDFYPAEPYHQDYVTRHPTEPYVMIHDLPKIAHLKRFFPQSYRSEAALVSKTGAGN